MSTADRLQPRPPAPQRGRPTPDPGRKVLARADLAALSAGAARAVLCHGCFDLLHPGHLRHLLWARSRGDLLIVTVTADRFIAKGPGRPAIPEADRALMLAALECVDGVSVAPEATGVESILEVRPRVYVKGAEYAGLTDPRVVEEKRAVERVGGVIEFSPAAGVMSSSALLGRLEGGQGAAPKSLPS